MSRLQRARQAIGKLIAGTEINPRPRPRSKLMGATSQGDLEFLSYLLKAATELNMDNEGFSLAVVSSVWVKVCLDVRIQAFTDVPFAIIDKATKREQFNTPLHNAFNWAESEYRQNVLRKMIMSLSVYGKSYYEKLLGEDVAGYAYPAGIRWLNPRSVRNEIQDGQIDYFEFQNGTDFYRFNPYQIFYQFYDNPRDDLDGLSPLAAAMRAVNVDENMLRYVQAFFLNDASTGGTLTPPPGVELDKTQMDLLDEVWKRQNAGVNNAFKTKLLPFDMKYQELQGSLFNQTSGGQTELTEAQKQRICAAMRVPRALAGATDVSDPLGASNTNDALKAIFYESWLNPELDDAEKFINAHFMAWLDPDRAFVFKRDKITSLIKQNSAVSALAISQYQAGAITYNRMRDKIGEPPIETELDFILMPQGYTAIPVAKIAKLPEIVAASASPYFSPAMVSITPAPPAQQAQLAAGTGSPAPAPQLPMITAGTASMRSLSVRVGKASFGKPSSTVLLSFRRNPLIDAIARQLQLTTDERDSRIRWTPPADFHITLLNLALVDNDDIEALEEGIAALVSDYPIDALTISGVGTFEKPGVNVLYLSVVPDEALADLHEAIYKLAVVLGLQVEGDQTAPDKWTPHITIGYFNDAVTLPVWTGEVRIEPDCIEITRSKYQTVEAVSLQSAIEEIDSELKAWQRFAVRRATGKVKSGKTEQRFNAVKIPAALAQAIQFELDQTPAESYAILEAARAQIKSGIKRIGDIMAAKAESKLTPELLAAVLARWQELGFEDALGQIDALEADDVIDVDPRDNDGSLPIDKNAPATTLDDSE